MKILEQDITPGPWRYSGNYVSTVQGGVPVARTTTISDARFIAGIHDIVAHVAELEHKLAESTPIIEDAAELIQVLNAQLVRYETKFAKQALIDNLAQACQEQANQGFAGPAREQAIDLLTCAGLLNEVQSLRGKNEA